MQMPFNWFDVVVVGLLIFGFFRGRKRGMSEELISVLMWLSIAIGCAFLYQPIGALIVGSGTVFSDLAGYLMGYIAAALVIAVLFALLRKAVGSKLVSAETFGRSEFYLGMIAGMVRYTCILIAALALLNARSYNNSEIKAEIKYQNDVYGSNFFPTLFTVQSQVFERSLSGPMIKQYLGPLLIKPTTPEKKQVKRKELDIP